MCRDFLADALEAMLRSGKGQTLLRGRVFGTSVKYSVIPPRRYVIVSQIIHAVSTASEKIKISSEIRLLVPSRK